MFSFLDSVHYNKDLVKSKCSLYRGSQFHTVYCNFGLAEENRLLYQELW